VFHGWLVEFFDDEFQLVAFFQIKTVSDFFWDRDNTPLSQFWITFHLSHTELYCLKHNNAVGFNPGVKPRGSRLGRLYMSSKIASRTVLSVS
ncbi:hypothetical protein PM032_18195, partial [Halorubrum ezzemoulense]|uniref:hypothetical protein n=1 Tax=Halorubrum ezzemoulense TaxID=337243 RepID=UPI00232E5ADB